MKGLLLVIIGIVVAACIFIPGVFTWIINTFFAAVNWFIHKLIETGLKT